MSSDRPPIVTNEDELFLSDLGEHTCPGSVCNRCAGGNLVRRYRRLEAEHAAMRCLTCNDVLATHSCGPVVEFVKPKVEAKWPKRIARGQYAPECDMECYPVGVVGPVVEGLRYLTHGHICRRVEGQCAPCAALAVFDAACEEEPKP